MVLEEDWPLAKKRRLIRKAIELYRIRGTVKGLKLFIALFTGHEPDIKENQWPFRGWRIGATSEIGTDSVVLPPVNLAHTFIVEMPVSYKDVSPESVIRIHEIIQMEKPANTQYYLRFASEGGGNDLSEFMAIGGGVAGGIGLGVRGRRRHHLRGRSRRRPRRRRSAPSRPQASADSKKTQMLEIDAAFAPLPKGKPPLPKAPRADTAPVEGKEGPRSSKAGGFEGAARQMEAINTQEFSAHTDDGGQEARGEGRGRQDQDAGSAVDEKQRPDRHPSRRRTRRKSKWRPNATRRRKGSRGSTSSRGSSPPSTTGTTPSATTSRSASCTIGCATRRASSPATRAS